MTSVVPCLKRWVAARSTSALVTQSRMPSIGSWCVVRGQALGIADGAALRIEHDEIGKRPARIDRHEHPHAPTPSLVSPQALYRYCPDMEALLDAVVDELDKRIPLPPDPGEDWCVGPTPLPMRCVTSSIPRPASPGSAAIGAAATWTQSVLDHDRAHG